MEPPPFANGDIVTYHRTASGVGSPAELGEVIAADWAPGRIRVCWFPTRSTWWRRTSVVMAKNLRHARPSAAGTEPRKDAQMVYRDPDSQIVYDDMPWKPKEEHRLFRVLLTDYDWLCIPPNAVLLEPPGYPYPPIEVMTSGRGTAGVHGVGPTPVFVTIPWTDDAFGMAQEYWTRCRDWLGPTALAAALAQLEIGWRELSRRLTADETAPAP